MFWVCMKEGRNEFPDIQWGMKLFHTQQGTSSHPAVSQPVELTTKALVRRR